MRKFDTGATRDTDVDKMDFEGFLSPRVLQRYAEYMNKHRTQADGNLRDSDNWQKGIPLDAYMKSGYRHFFDWWVNHRGITSLAKDDIEESLCALIFNAMGYLHGHLKSCEGDYNAAEIDKPEECSECHGKGYLKDVHAWRDGVMEIENQKCDTCNKYADDKEAQEVMVAESRSQFSPGDIVFITLRECVGYTGLLNSVDEYNHIGTIIKTIEPLFYELYCVRIGKAEFRLYADEMIILKKGN